MDRSLVKMIVGLGNPGVEYTGTRHNIGFRVIDLLSDFLGIEVRRKKFGGLFGRGEFAGEKIVLLKPMKFMNCSGQVVSTAAGFYRVSFDDLLVITDDMALEPGRLRLRSKGSAGGHKGLVDIITKLGTENISRLRVGIGQSGRDSAVDFVLDKPTEAEKALLDETVERARRAVIYWIEYGIEAAMNRYNKRG